MTYVGIRVFTLLVQKLKSVSNKYQQLLSQWVSKVLLRHARLYSCAGVIISVNIAPVRYLRIQVQCISLRSC